MEYALLIKEAFKGRKNAYAPYSNFKVGAAVMMEDGSVYNGCNIENASFGATNCAERTAIFKAVADGKNKIKALAVCGAENQYTFPCGICRQVLVEFSSAHTEIIIIKNEKEYLIKNIEEILPGAFSKKDLEK